MAYYYFRLVKNIVTLRCKIFETIKEIFLRPNHVIEAQQFDVDLLNSIFSTAQEMEQVVPLAVPLVTDLKMGRNWSEMS